MEVEDPNGSNLTIDNEQWSRDVVVNNYFEKEYKPNNIDAVENIDFLDDWGNELETLESSFQDALNHTGKYEELKATISNNIANIDEQINITETEIDQQTNKSSKPDDLKNIIKRLNYINTSTSLLVDCMQENIDRVNKKFEKIENFNEHDIQRSIETRCDLSQLKKDFSYFFLNLTFISNDEFVQSRIEEEQIIADQYRQKVDNFSQKIVELLGRIIQKSLLLDALTSEKSTRRLNRNKILKDIEQVIEWRIQIGIEKANQIIECKLQRWDQCLVKKLDERISEFDKNINVKLENTERVIDEKRLDDHNKMKDEVNSEQKRFKNEMSEIIEKSTNKQLRLMNDVRDTNKSNFEVKLKQSQVLTEERSELLKKNFYSQISNVEAAMNQRVKNLDNELKQEQSKLIANFENRFQNQTEKTEVILNSVIKLSNEISKNRNQCEQKIDESKSTLSSYIDLSSSSRETDRKELNNQIQVILEIIQKLEQKIDQQTCKILIFQKRVDQMSTETTKKFETQSMITNDLKCDFNTHKNNTNKTYEKVKAKLKKIADDFTVEKSLDDEIKTIKSTITDNIKEFSEKTTKLQTQFNEVSENFQKCLNQIEGLESKNTNQMNVLKDQIDREVHSKLMNVNGNIESELNRNNLTCQKMEIKINQLQHDLPKNLEQKLKNEIEQRQLKHTNIIESKIQDRIEDSKQKSKLDIIETVSETFSLQLQTVDQTINQLKQLKSESVKNNEQIERVDRYVKNVEKSFETKFHTQTILIEEKLKTETKEKESLFQQVDQKVAEKLKNLQSLVYEKVEKNQLNVIKSFEHQIESVRDANNQHKEKIEQLKNEIQIINEEVFKNNEKLLFSEAKYQENLEINNKLINDCNILNTQIKENRVQFEQFQRLIGKISVEIEERIEVKQNENTKKVNDQLVQMKQDLIKDVNFKFDTIKNELNSQISTVEASTSITVKSLDDKIRRNQNELIANVEDRCKTQTENFFKSVNKLTEELETNRKQNELKINEQKSTLSRFIEENISNQGQDIRRMVEKMTGETRMTTELIKCTNKELNDQIQNNFKCIQILKHKFDQQSVDQTSNQLKEMKGELIENNTKIQNLITYVGKTEKSFELKLENALNVSNVQTQCEIDQIKQSTKTIIEEINTSVDQRVLHSEMKCQEHFKKINKTLIQDCDILKSQIKETNMQIEQLQTLMKKVGGDIQERMNIKLDENTNKVNYRLLQVKKELTEEVNSKFDIIKNDLNDQINLYIYQNKEKELLDLLKLQLKNDFDNEYKIKENLLTVKLQNAITENVSKNNQQINRVENNFYSSLKENKELIQYYNEERIEDQTKMEKYFTNQNTRLRDEINTIQQNAKEEFNKSINDVIERNESNIDFQLKQIQKKLEDLDKALKKDFNSQISIIKTSMGEKVESLDNEIKICQNKFIYNVEGRCELQDKKIENLLISVDKLNNNLEKDKKQCEQRNAEQKLALSEYIDQNISNQIKDILTNETKKTIDTELKFIESTKKELNLQIQGNSKNIQLLEHKLDKHFFDSKKELEQFTTEFNSKVDIQLQSEMIKNFQNEINKSLLICQETQVQLFELRNDFTTELKQKIENGIVQSQLIHNKQIEFKIQNKIEDSYQKLKTEFLLETQQANSNTLDNLENRLTEFKLNINNMVSNNFSFSLQSVEQTISQTIDQLKQLKNESIENDDKIKRLITNVERIENNLKDKLTSEEKQLNKYKSVENKIADFLNVNEMHEQKIEQLNLNIETVKKEILKSIDQKLKNFEEKHQEGLMKLNNTEQTLVHNCNIVRSQMKETNIQIEQLQTLVGKIGVDIEERLKVKQNENTNIINYQLSKMKQELVDQVKNNVDSKFVCINSELKGQIFHNKTEYDQEQRESIHQLKLELTKDIRGVIQNNISQLDEQNKSHLTQCVNKLEQTSNINNEKIYNTTTKLLQNMKNQIELDYKTFTKENESSMWNKFEEKTKSFNDDFKMTLAIQENKLIKQFDFTITSQVEQIENKLTEQQNKLIMCQQLKMEQQFEQKLETQFYELSRLIEKSENEIEEILANCVQPIGYQVQSQLKTLIDRMERKVLDELQTLQGKLTKLGETKQQLIRLHTSLQQLQNGQTSAMQRLTDRVIEHRRIIESDLHERTNTLAQTIHTWQVCSVAMFALVAVFLVLR